MGFPNSTESTAPLDIVTGCRINSTHPGPCFAYADGLDTAQIYYLWAVIGCVNPLSPCACLCHFQVNGRP